MLGTAELVALWITIQVLTLVAGPQVLQVAQEVGVTVNLTDIPLFLDIMPHLQQRD
jgi:hypothetical protein